MAAHFTGLVRVEWIQHAGDDRRMKLLDDFEFIDDANKSWVAPANSEIDGASIPEILWTSNGSPFIGDYRRASVLHDVHCVLRTEPHRAVHRMFYDAMITDGVGTFTAKKMYAAVRLFGPSWTVGGPGDAAGPLAAMAPALAEGPAIDDLELALDQVLGD